MIFPLGVVILYNLNPAPDWTVAVVSSLSSQTASHDNGQMASIGALLTIGVGAAITGQAMTTFWQAKRKPIYCKQCINMWLAR